ncbi:hypothetical protein ABKN59_012020 [Abortiporus biennis]
MHNISLRHGLGMIALSSTCNSLQTTHDLGKRVTVMQSKVQYLDDAIKFERGLGTIDRQWSTHHHEAMILLKVQEFLLDSWTNPNLSCRE